MTVPAFNSVAWFEFGTGQPGGGQGVLRRRLGAEVLMEPVSDSAGFTFA